MMTSDAIDPSAVTFTETMMVPIRIKAWCPECGEELKAKWGRTGAVKTDWVHECVLGHRVVLPKSYPTIEYRRYQVEENR